MSTDAVRQFLTRVAEDPALQELAKSTAKGAQDPTAAAVELGSKQGFEFTTTEFSQVIESVRRAAGEPVGDAELEGVAGGLAPLRPAEFLAIKYSPSLLQAGTLFLGGLDATLKKRVS